MNYLAERKLIKPDTRFDLLGNTLVLIAPKDSKIETNDRRGLPARQRCSATGTSPWPIPTRCRPANTARRR